MTTLDTSMYEAAVGYVAADLSVLPIDPNPTKSPAVGMLPVVGHWNDGQPRRGWGPLRTRKPTADELEFWFASWGCLAGIGVVCGAISGGLEAIDIDSIEYVEPWLSQVRHQRPELVDRLVLVQTRVLYFCC